MSKPNRDKRKQFLLDQETAEKLKAVADLKQVSENEIVNRSLAAYLKRFNKVTPVQLDPVDVTKEVLK